MIAYSIGCQNLTTWKAVGHRRWWWSPQSLELSWPCQGEVISPLGLRIRWRSEEMTKTLINSQRLELMTAFRFMTLQHMRKRLTTLTSAQTVPGFWAWAKTRCVITYGPRLQVLLFQRAIVWDVKKGKKHAELGWESPAGVKYVFKVEHFLFSNCWPSGGTCMLSFSSQYSSEGEVWVCGGRREEIQSVHD